MRTLARSLVLSCPHPEFPCMAQDSSVERDAGQDCCLGWKLGAECRCAEEAGWETVLAQNCPDAPSRACLLRKGVHPPGLARDTKGKSMAGSGPLYPIFAGRRTAVKAAFPTLPT